MNASPTFEQVIFPDVISDNWQMMQWERIALTGILSRLRPQIALEIGVYYGGSLSLTSQYANHIIAIDLDPDVPNRFPRPDNVDLRIGDSVDLIPRILKEIEEANTPLNFVLIDADHSSLGVKRDIELVLQYQPKAPMIILIHDSGNPECRKGVLNADWSANPCVQLVDCDFIPGQIIEHSVSEGRGEIWGGFAIAYLNGQRRDRGIEIRQSAKTSLSCLHASMQGQLLR